MLVVLFQLGNERFAVPGENIRSIVPRVPCRPLPGTPPGVVGVFSFRGEACPVLDLRQIQSGEPAPEALSTRLIVVDYPRGNRTAPLGLLVARLLDTAEIDESAIQEPAVHAPEAPYLGRLVEQDGQYLQFVEVAELLPADLAQKLFPAA